MKEILLKKSLSFLVVFTLILIFSSQAQAASATLDLNQLTLTGITDAAGRWQYAGGEVYLDGAYIANYATVRRVVTDGTVPNAAMVTMTILIQGEDPPQSVTLQGVHSYNTGGYTGSISAASSSYSWLIGATFSGSTSTDTLTITW
jgi:hypothetical protein